MGSEVFSEGGVEGGDGKRRYSNSKNDMGNEYGQVDGTRQVCALEAVGGKMEVINKVAGKKNNGSKEGSNHESGMKFHAFIFNGSKSCYEQAKGSEVKKNVEDW